MPNERDEYPLSMGCEACGQRFVRVEHGYTCRGCGAWLSFEALESAKVIDVDGSVLRESGFDAEPWRIDEIERALNGPHVDGEGA